MLKNLAGAVTCDLDIQRELEVANVDIRSVPLGNTTVPYTMVGLSGKWTFRRASCYWTAHAEIGFGFSKEVNDELHKYFLGAVYIVGFRDFATAFRWLEHGGRINYYRIESLESLKAFAMLAAVLKAW